MEHFRKILEEKLTSKKCCVSHISEGVRSGDGGVRGSQDWVGGGGEEDDSDDRRRGWRRWKRQTATRREGGGGKEREHEDGGQKKSEVMMEFWNGIIEMGKKNMIRNAEDLKE